MVEIPDIIKKQINAFINLLEENDFQIQKAYLYGTYANGNPDEWSDIDLALVSSKFLGNRYLDMMSLTDYILKAGADISPLPFSIEDFENSMFARDEIVKKGVSII